MYRLLMPLLIGLAAPGFLSDSELRAQSSDSTWIDHAGLVADLGQLSDFIERTHPQPYGRDGKLVFHRHLHELLRSLPEEGMSRKRFHALLQPFVARLGDGHTRIEPLRDLRAVVDGPGLPLDLRILAQTPSRPVPGLFVQAVPSLGEDHRGAELIAIEGVPVIDLIRRERRLEAYDNEFDNLRRLNRRLQTRQGLLELIPEWGGGDSVSLALVPPRGDEVRLVLPLGEVPRSWDDARVSTVDLPKTRTGEPAFRFLDEDRRVALLRIDNTWAHREIFESLVKVGQGNLQWAQSFYRAYTGESAPDDTVALVTRLPSAGELFERLVVQMREAETETLIVDLRRNTGGHSVMVNMLLYYLHGRDGWFEFFGNMHTIRRLTPEDVDDTDETGELGFPDRIGDYDFSSVFEAAERTPAEAGNERYLKAITLEFARELEAGRFAGYYVPPQVIVLSGPSTFSGGFWLATALYRLGGRLAGVPSGQAPNAFADVVRLSLEHSQIGVGVSSRLFNLFPEQPASFDVLPVTGDLLTYDAWRRTGYDPNAEILLLLGRY